LLHRIGKNTPPTHTNNTWEGGWPGEGGELISPTNLGAQTPLAFLTIEGKYEKASGKVLDGHSPNSPSSNPHMPPNPPKPSKGR